jgi:glycosyltransferase involved in cell wall biosynthesis
MEKICLSEFITSKGELILYCGNPNFDLLDKLADGPGDIWHSSFEQGYKNAFPELVYQTAVLFWYLNDFDSDQCVSWRINPGMFAIRKKVWDFTGGFDADFSSNDAAALDFGFNCLRYLGIVPMYIKDLYSLKENKEVTVSAFDRHLFYRKNFKRDHAIYMILRKGFWNIREWYYLFRASGMSVQRNQHTHYPARTLQAINGSPSVSYIIPTMFRHEFALQLLEDLAKQTYIPTQVIVVDATPDAATLWESVGEHQYPFQLEIVQQHSKGSCRARNEAIALCTGDYIVFGDDDIRVSPEFIYNHISFLVTNGAEACNGLDIRADNAFQNLDVLNRKLESFGPLRWRAGASVNFSNANSCVRAERVRQLGGNDINFDGGYGEDSDFGLSLSKAGVVVLFNPFSTNLHLKPEAGGYRWWGSQNKLSGKNRKRQPWEFEPVGLIKPVPSPTVMYGILKHFNSKQVLEYKYKNLTYFLIRGPILALPLRIIKLPYKLLQFGRSKFYAKALLQREIS